MLDLVETILLSQWTVLMILLCAMLLVSYWALLLRREYAGYALGALLGLFFVVVYGALAEASTVESRNIDTGLGFFSVIMATLFGLILGGTVQVALKAGSKYPRIFSLQVAFYTGLNAILLFVAIIENPSTQRTIGVFALAFAIATLFGVVIFGNPNTVQAESVPAQATPYDSQNFPAVTPDIRATSRLDQIRENIRNQNRQ